MKAETISTCYRFAEQECLLSPGEVPAAGAHVMTIRRGYSHHGIYVGDGRVVHYAGLSRGWSRGPIEEVSLEQFADGRTVFMRPHTIPRFDRAEVVDRARSRIGESSYQLLTNNCEHFCEWCIRGEPRSQQVEVLKRAPRRLLRALVMTIRRRLDEWLWQEPGRGGWAV